MQIRFSIVLQFAGLLIALPFANAETAIPPAPKTPDLVPAYIEQLLEDLSSPDFEDREVSTKVLRLGGLDVVRALTAEMKKKNSESSLRAFQIVKDIYFDRMRLSLDDQSDEIELQLESVLKAGSPEAQNRVVKLFNMFQGTYAPEFIEKNAIRRLQALGAKFRTSIFFATNQTSSFNTRLEKPFGKNFDIVLSGNWKGSSDSMRFFRRLATINRNPRENKVYLLPDAKLTFDEKLELKANLPMGSFEERGNAILGVKSNLRDSGFGAFIGEVVPNLPADRAGIKEGDLIVKIGESKIGSFVDLIDAVAKFKPEDSTEIYVIRGNRPLKLSVTFDAW